MKKRRLTKAGKITIVLYFLLHVIIIAISRDAEVRLGWIPTILLFSIYGIIFNTMSEEYERKN